MTKAAPLIKRFVAIREKQIALASDVRVAMTKSETAGLDRSAMNPQSSKRAMAARPEPPRGRNAGRQLHG